jgi:hypothetical protein
MLSQESKISEWRRKNSPAAALLPRFFCTSPLNDPYPSHRSSEFPAFWRRSGAFAVPFPSLTIHWGRQPEGQKYLLKQALMKIDI